MIRITGARRMAVIAAASLLAAAGPAAAQEARVLGRVTDGVGNAIADATVTLVPHDSTVRAQATVSGPTGGFQFQPVAPGRYTIRAEHPGYGVREQRITVRPGRVVTPVVRLREMHGGGAVAARTAHR